MPGRAQHSRVSPSAGCSTGCPVDVRELEVVVDVGQAEHHVVADRLAAEGHEPVLLDALVPQAHGDGPPAGIDRYELSGGASATPTCWSGCCPGWTRCVTGRSWSGTVSIRQQHDAGRRRADVRPLRAARPGQAAADWTPGARAANISAVPAGGRAGRCGRRRRLPLRTAVFGCWPAGSPPNTPCPASGIPGGSGTHAEGLDRGTRSEGAHVGEERAEHRRGGTYTTAGKEFVRDTRYITTRITRDGPRPGRRG